jgi:hypothetical protein
MKKYLALHGISPSCKDDESVTGFLVQFQINNYNCTNDIILYTIAFCDTTMKTELTS